MLPQYAVPELEFDSEELELITRVHADPDAAIGELTDVHRYVYQNLQDELLWAGSMPCILGDDRQPGHRHLHRPAAENRPRVAVCRPPD